MRKEKQIVIALRKSGKSYRAIRDLTSVPLSTLTEWLKDKEWSKIIKQNNNILNTKRSTECLRKLNSARKKALELKYSVSERRAIDEFELYKENPLFIAGLMLYAGEGDKRNKYNIKFTNTEFELHKIFIEFMVNFLDIQKNNIKFWLIVYPDNKISALEKFWSIKLGINKDNFHKTQVIQGKSKTRKLHFGVGNSIVSSISTKKKLLKWIDLYKKQFIS